MELYSLVWIEVGYVSSFFMPFASMDTLKNGGGLVLACHSYILRNIGLSSNLSIIPYHVLTNIKIMPYKPY